MKTILVDAVNTKANKDTRDLVALKDFLDKNL